jgi:ABC-type glutathione transport system ATPase component
MIRQTQSDSQAVSKRIGSGIDNFKTLDEKETTPSLHHTFPSFVATNHRIPLRKLSRSNQYSAKSLEIRRKLLDQSESLKHNEFLQQLTINKIQYDQIFVGREKEIRTLKNRLSRAVYSKPKTRRKELIFIKGYSGVGKSTLASALEQSVKETRTGMFVRGKFDLNHNDEPYSGKFLAVLFVFLLA